MPFQAILSTLIETHAPIARAATFCDSQGERVGSHALADVVDFDVALLGAAYAPIARCVAAHATLRVVHGDRSVWIASVEGGYYLVVLCQLVCDGAIRLSIPRAVAALAAHM